ncbi:MAG: hypothetical protein WBG42_06745, partial [Cryomorphaceae bacterium]
MILPRYLSVFILLALSTPLLGGGFKDADKDVLIYSTDREYSIIGRSASSAYDLPNDNSHVIVIPELPSDFDAYLIYELKGAKNSSALAKSFNGQVALGGFLAEPSAEWVEIHEDINPAVLRAGKNTLVFSLPTTAPYFCELKNVRLVIKSLATPNQKLSIDENSLVKSGKNYYLKGNTSSSISEIKIEGRRVPVYSGQFEYFAEIDGDRCIIETNDKVDPYQKLEIKRKAFSEVSISNDLNSSGFSAKLIDNSLNCLGLHLQWDDEMGLRPERIEAFALREIDLPAIQPDVVNVTKLAYGYRVSGLGDAEASLSMG